MRRSAERFSSSHRTRRRQALGNTRIGREGIRFAIEELTEIRLLVLRTPPKGKGMHPELYYAFDSHLHT